MELYQSLILWAAGLMIILVFVNLYIRVRVWKHYIILNKNKVDFPTSYIMKPDKMEAEIIPRYPEYADNIRAFSKHLRISLRIASVLLMLITLLAAVIYYYR